jgi:hypothetical protein
VKLKKVPLDKEIDLREKSSAAENFIIPQKINLNDKFQLEIVCDEIPRINITILPEEDRLLQEIVPDENSPKRNPSLKNWQKSNEEKRTNLTSILKKVTSNVQNIQRKKKTVNFLLPTESKLCKNSSNFSGAIKAPFIINRKFKNIIENFFINFSKTFTNKNEVPQLIRVVFIRTRTFDVYWKLVYHRMMLAKKNKQDGAATTTTNGSGSGSTVENFAKPKRPMSSEEYSKKVNRKLEDYRGLILPNAENTIEKDCSFALNYLERVKKMLIENGDEELFAQFAKMLTSFNPEIESVPELYYVSEY